MMEKICPGVGLVRNNNGRIETFIKGKFYPQIGYLTPAFHTPDRWLDLGEIESLNPGWFKDWVQRRLSC